MNPKHQLPDHGQSGRASAGVKASMAHLPGGRTQKSLVGEGMPNPLPTMAIPAKGATPPMTLNPSNKPGQGASNPFSRKAKP